MHRINRYWPNDARKRPSDLPTGDALIPARKGKW